MEAFRRLVLLGPVVAVALAAGCGGAGGTRPDARPRDAADGGVDGVGADGAVEGGRAEARDGLDVADLAPGDSHDGPADLARVDGAGGEGGGTVDAASFDGPGLDGPIDAPPAVDLGPPPVDAPIEVPVDLPPDMPVCPAPGASAGTGCASAGARSCGGSAALTCTLVAASGCRIWVMTEDCAAAAGGALACELAGGTPVCRCPAPSGGALHVDPVAGRASGGTGAAEPAACRFRGLGQAIAAVSGTFTRVVASSAGASAAAPATFAGEAFPLLIPAGVTVTTADASPTPANYKIAFAGATAASADAAVVLAPGAALSGFTVENAGGHLEASALRCSSGTVNVRGVRLVGTGGGTTLAVGLSIGQSADHTCALQAQGLTVERFAVGVQVLSAGTSALDASTLADNPIGLRLVGGTVTANGLAVVGTGAAEASFGVRLEGAAGAPPPVFNAQGLLVRRLGRRGLELLEPAGAPPATATLTGGEIDDTEDTAIYQESDSLTLAGTYVHDSALFGLEAHDAGTTVTLGPGTRVDGNGAGGIYVKGATLTGTQVSASGNRNGSGGLVDGLRVEGGSVVLHRATLDDNEGRAVFLDSGELTLDDGSLLRGNGKQNGSSAIRYKSGIFRLGGASGGVVEVSDSGRHGLYVWTQEGTGTGLVEVTRTRFINHAGVGVWVDFVPGAAGGSFRMTASEVAGNAVHGVRLDRAPAVAAGAEGSGVLLSDVDIHDNGRANLDGLGVWAQGLGDLAFTLRGSRVRANRSTGLRVEQAAGATVTSYLEGNDVTGNNTGAEQAVGGVHFATASTLASFRGNRLHANAGAELGFEARPNGGGAWTLGSGACDAGANRLYCYGAAPADVGLLLAGPTAITVAAPATFWSTPTPTAPTDWRADGSPGHTFTAAPACTPAPTCAD